MSYDLGLSANVKGFSKVFFAFMEKMATVKYTLRHRVTIFPSILTYWSFLSQIPP